MYRFIASALNFMKASRLPIFSIKLFTLVSVFLIGLSPSVFANNTIEPKKIEVMGVSNILQVILSLLFIVALIFAMAWYFKRIQYKSAGKGQKLQVLAALAVGARERVVLVQVGDEQILLGVATGRVNLIKTFDQPILDPHELSQSQNFLNVLRDAVGSNDKTHDK